MTGQLLQLPVRYRAPVLERQQLPRDRRRQQRRALTIVVLLVASLLGVAIGMIGG